MKEAILPIFKRCVEAIRGGVLIKKVSTSDKEYHFQNWFMARLEEIKLNENDFNYDTPGRNTYPDFRMVKIPEGYELKSGKRLSVYTRSSGA